MEKSSGVFESFQCLFSVDTKSRSLLTLEIIAAVFIYYCQLKKKKRKSNKQLLLCMDIAYSERKIGKTQEITY